MKRAKRERRRAWTRARKSGLNAHYELYKQAQENVRKAIATTKADYENKLVDSLTVNPKRFYSYCRHFTRTSATVSCLEHERVKITSDTEKAEVLNQFFTSVMTEEPDMVGAMPPPKRTPETHVYDRPITTEHVREKMKKLAPNKAGGPDGIHVNVLRAVSNLATPLADIFNHSLTIGYVPQDWRDANITPLFKKGSRLSANNYRPVSLTSQVAKLMERLVLDTVTTHIQDNNLISSDQHGFQANASCVSQLVECMADWTDVWDEGSQTDIIYLDFRKAFDTVPH